MKKVNLAGLSEALLCVALAATVGLGVSLSGCRKVSDKENGNSVFSSAASEDTSQSDSSEMTVSDSSENENTYVSSAPEIQETDADKYVKPAPQRNRAQVTVTQINKSGSKKYIERLGKPYLQYGVQITTGRTENETEEFEEGFYEKAKEIGFKTVLKTIKWCDVEPQENTYNMYTVSQMLRYAEKYDLTLELLWYGGNVGSKNTYAPGYVKENTERFPTKSGGVLDFGNKELIRREKAALGQVLNYIYDNDKNRRVSVIQIENEPASANCWSAQTEEFLNYLDEMGKTVKNSCYRTVTRVNLAVDTYYLREDFTLMSRILGLGGIDMVGPDVYTRDLEYFIRYIERFSSGDTEENVMHIAEGPGQLYNYGKIVTTCFANNSGYYTYELKSYGGLNFDFGIFRNSATEWIKRDGTKKVMYQWDMLTKVAEYITDDITVFNGMVNSVSEQIAACPKNQFKGIFRGKSEKIGTQEIAYDTSDSRVANRIGAVFLADDGYYYMFTLASDATFTFKGKSISGSVSAGAFVNGEWKENFAAGITDGNVLNCKSGTVYRLSSGQLR